MKKQWMGLAAMMVTGMAFATLPPPDAAAQEKAAAAKSKGDWSKKVAAYQLCLAQDRVAAGYLKEKGKSKPDIAVPPCVNPGPYVPPPQAMKDGASTKK